MCVIDLKPCECWSERDRRARKVHRCQCCLGEIYPGEVYLSHMSVFEGEFSSGKLCVRCSRDRSEFAEAHDGMMCQPGWLRNLLAECIAEGDEGSERWRVMLDRIEHMRALSVPSV